MNNKLLLIFIIFSVFAVNCSEKKENNNNSLKKTTSETCIAKDFDQKQTEGKVTSEIVRWEEAGEDAFGGLWISIGKNDSLLFRVIPEETQNVVKSNLEKGNCVSIEYYTEIIEEEGIEINRFFYAAHLDYP